MAHSTSSYSEDLRQRVVEARCKGLKVREIIELFQVSESSVRRWMAQHRKTGNVTPKQRGGYKQPKIKDFAKFEAFAKERAHMTLKQMKAHWEDEVNEMDLSRALKRMGWTRKKRASATGNAMKRNGRRS